jgi:hypothetical protein
MNGTQRVVRVRACARGSAASLLFLCADADAQTLRKLEQSHQSPKKNSESSRPSGSSSSSSAGASSSSVSSSNADESDASDSIVGAVCGSACSAMAPALLYAGCILPPFIGVCADTSYRIQLDAYVPRHLYVPARSGDAANPSTRHVELRLGGFTASKLRIFGAGAELRAWYRPMMFAVEWIRLLEPSSPETRALDLMRVKLGANLPLGPRVELYPTMGLFLLRGEEWTPAFHVGIEGRAYPYKPIVLFSSVEAAIFARGNPLAEIRLEPGLTFGSFDLRAGFRLMYQSGIGAFGGPSLSAAGRL